MIQKKYLDPKVINLYYGGMEPEFILFTIVGLIVFTGISCILLSLLETDKYEYDEVDASFIPLQDNNKNIFDSDDLIINYDNIDNDFYSHEL